MMMRFDQLFPALLFLAVACSPIASNQPSRSEVVLTSTTILADIARNVAGDRLSIESILPIGADPHEYEPVPADLAGISDARLLIINGAGYEESLMPYLENTPGSTRIVEASAGLSSRTDPEMEHGLDPHYWQDPNYVINYVENIRDGFIDLDPQAALEYRSNAAAYIVQLQELDGWIEQQVSGIPIEHRLLVTNHDALGYFADRYGFKVMGTILKSASSQASVSAQELSATVELVNSTGVPAIFLDAVENPNLADQIAEETGVAVVDDLHIESLTSGPPAGTYLDMMKHNVSRIVQALE